MQVQSLVWGDPLEEGMATHFSLLAWRRHKGGGEAGAESMEGTHRGVLSGTEGR